MHDRLGHRGPDGGGRWCAGPVGLGHQLLSTTPEARFDDQPVRDGDLVGVVDARIDNREELLRTLPTAGASNRVPDSELVVLAYRRWGSRCVDHLIGAFAFAIWNRTEKTLFCARDHVGIKPFYYHRSADRFAFGTELRALLTVPTVSADVDETTIGDFLTGVLEDERRTFCEAIDRLPPAHAMCVDSAGIDQWRYWDLDPTRTISLESDTAYERRFRELLEEAVGCRLRSSGPVGAQLSGGLDSSSVTVVARDLLPETETLHTFSNVFDDAPSSDEREFVETVVDRPGIESHYVSPEGCGALVDRDRLTRQFDRPPHNTIHFGEWKLAERAAEAGVDVALSGALGDSAINYGLGLLPQLFRTGRWLALSRELRAMSDVADAPVWHLFARHVVAPLVPEPVKRRRRRRRGQPVLVARANPTLDPSFVDRTDLRSRYRTLSSPGSVFVRSTDRKRQYRSITAGRNVANFETADLIAGAFGVEPRYPFADRRLLEFSLAISPRQQFADGWTRSLVRRSLEDLLPEPIRRRPWKTMMNEAFWNELTLETDRLAELVADPGPVTRYLDIDALEAAVDRFENEPTSRDARALWRALSLSVWLDSTGSPPREEYDVPTTNH
ncbi:asparagine synthetase B [Natrarchaeobius chitinivorans]|uniref:Putative asparagine synthetase [glutamine-hydrolyzing] n=2 Tax=Natrarchaeobius chitinivorans TaxID=1679083 RepID=A0A3N6MZH0_NATCH|nr:asparagine synthetase B [Natrarchaeobius chitinivorans]